MLKQVTSGIPIVMAFTADAVGSGFVANLRRPGGNITGLININEALTGKRLELLKELNPRISRVAVLKTSGHHCARCNMERGAVVCSVVRVQGFCRRLP